ncbi:MAG: autotransporter domain-containing protein, partial [Zoogloea sp.]|nr:autotransporter domain-containing protein [Zoogloea sp.]
AAGPLALNDGTLHTTASFTTARATSLTGTGTLTTDAGTTLQDTGAVSGTGALLKNGAGTLQLCGDVSNSGGASVAAGRLDLCGNYTAPGAVSIASGATVALVGTTSLGSASGLANDGTLDISGTTSSLGSTITALTGGGEVVLGNRNLNLSNASGNFGGVISGTGGVAVKGGSQTFSGANTYTGATTIDSGATLALNGAGTAGVASTLVNNGSFDVSGSAAGASIATVVGSGNVILGSQSLTLSNASGNFDGVISGTGGLNVASGVVALGGVSTYTGGTTIGNGATVRVSSDANLGGAGGVLNLNGGTLQSTSSFTTARDINVTGAGTLQADNGTTLSGSGVVSGSGALVKNGAGAVVLSGDLAHTGGTVVNQGSLQLAGTNSYTGGTTLNGGTLKVASDASLGAASSAITFNGGTLQATTSFSSARDVNATGGGTVATDAGATLSLTGSLVGTGQLNKTGAGTLVLSGDSSGDHTVGSGWTGGMIVNGGLVQVTNAWGLGWGNVTVNGGTVNTTVDILTGQSIILAGNTTVNVDTGTTTTLSGTITDTGSDSGGSSGCFVKSGLGTLNLTGVMTQSNGTCVQQGELRANGTLDSVVSVDSPAILRGTGLVNGPISVHGILAPGNSPGTLTTTGTVTMLAGSSFQADINGLGTASGPGNYSRLLVTGAGNQFVAGGATLAPNLTAITGAVTYTPYVPQLGDTFRIITADGGISGRFAPLAQPDGMATGTRMAVFYDVFGSNSVDLRVIPTSYASGLQAVNGNARALGAAVDRIVTADQQGASTTAQGQLFYTLAGLNAAQLPGVMTALSGEVHAALAAAAPRAGQWTQGAIGRQLGSGSSRNAADSTDLHDHRALWIEMGANRGQWSSDSTSSGFRTDRTQFAIGGDVASTANARLGVGFSHASSNLAMSGVSASGSMDENLFFGYGQYRTGGYAIDGMLGYGSSTWESTRVDPIAGAGSLKTHQRGENWLAGLAVRKPVELLTTVVEPFVRTLFQQTTRGDVSEGSASTAALSLDKYSANGFRAMVGVAAGSIRKDPLSAPYTYQAEIGVGQDSGNAVRPTLRASLAGESFTVAGPQVGRSFGQIGVSGTLRLAPQVFAYIGLTGEARSGQSDIGGNLGVRVAF